MRIQHNIMAMNAYRNYNTNTSALSRNLEKLSSGYKINRAGDDAAGLAISEKMRAQITGLNAAQKNVKDGISLVKTAEGAMQEIQDMLNRMDYLATQSANGTYDNEVDRANLQKEVEQLKSEINRIADSSNFNGIKLLDGKLGLNDSAFSFSSADATVASDGTIDVSDIVSNEHLENAASTGKAPTATIDLGKLAFTGAKKDDTLTFTINGKDYTVTAAADNGFDNTTDIGARLLTAMQGSSDNVNPADGKHSATAADNTAIRIGDAAFTFTAGMSASQIKLVYAGRYVGDKYKAETTFSGTQEEADAINKTLGFDVELKSSNTVGQEKGNVVHKATKVEHAVAAKGAGYAGIDIDLRKVVVDGGTLTIDGKTFTFKTDPKSTITATPDPADGTGGLIDVSKAKTEEEALHMAADMLSKITVTGAESRTWKIGVNGDGTTIHIDQSVASDTGKELDTHEKLLGVISAKGQATVDANKGTTIKIDKSKVQEGDTLTIDGKTYVFADKAETKIPEGATKVAIKGGAAKNLAAALGVAANDFNETKGTVTVRAASADDDAPVIQGKGLQLQIGDTSDSYNQLKVSIGDMHTAALGIADLDISNPESASDAIQTIKDAINQVSSVRGDLGATQNRLEHTANNLSVMAENIQDAESTIRDTDVAEEMMAYTKNNILVQSAQAMLAQANAVPQGVLQLLG